MDKKQFDREMKYECLYLFYKNLHKKGEITDFELSGIERWLREKYRPIIMQINLYNA